MVSEGGWNFVRVLGETSIPVEFTEDGLEELGIGPVNLCGKIGQPLGLVGDGDGPEDIVLVQTLDGVLAKVPLAELEEYVPEAGENGGFDCAWPLTEAEEDPVGWQLFGQSVCEQVRWKGFCVIHFTMSQEERTNLRTPVAGFSADKWRRLPSDVEEVYLGRNPKDKMCWADASSLEAEESLQKCDRALTDLAALLSPLTDEYFNFSGYGRTGTMVRTPIKSDSERKVLDKYMKELPLQELTQGGFGLSPKVESYVSFAQLRRLCMMQFAAGSGGVLRLHPKFGIDWLEEVDIPCEENRVVVFRHDLMSYTYAPTSADSVALQTWMLSEPHATAVCGFEEEGIATLDFQIPKYGQSGHTVGVMAVHKTLPASVHGCDENWAMFISCCDTTVTVEGINRWDHDQYFEENRDRASATGKQYSRHGGFVSNDDMFTFDAEFFGYSAEEANSMDPGHRNGLEVGYLCMKKAGFKRDTLNGKNIGVHIGNSGSDWSWHHEQVVRYKGEPLFASATSGSLVAARLSLLFGMRGPTAVVDTACSSSLVATNASFWGLRPVEPGQLKPTQGRQPIWGLCSGINALVGPATWIGLCGPKMLSGQGRCFTFDSSADGFNRAEGFTSVMLKHLTEVEEQSDRLAMVCGGCINQDGKSASMTAPHGPSQQECIRNSLRESNLTPADIRVAELHGTGTALGDPIEVGALRGVMKVRKTPIFKTTGKVNYGHLEANAGISGFSKCVLMLTHGVISPNCHLRSLNPNTDTSQYPVMFTDLALYIGNSGYAGVSSFGFGGTNARGDVWARALTGPFNTGGELMTMDRLDYIKGRKQDLLDRSNALEDPDFSDAFREKLQITLRAGYSRQEADVVGGDMRLTYNDWLGKQVVQDPEPPPIGPGTGKEKKELPAITGEAQAALPASSGEAQAAEQAVKDEPFTKERAMAMQADLISYYKEAEFQSSIKKVYEEAQGDKKVWMAARSNLLFEKVQTHVVGKYGFENSKKGVALSNMAFNPYNEDPEVTKNNQIMMWYTFPDLQVISLEQYLEEQGRKNPATAADQPIKDEPFTKERALAMQAELISYYKDPEFQTSIKKVYEEAQGDKKAWMAARSNLLFEKVQTHVVGKYGFENSKKGVALSNMAFNPYNEDPDVGKNNQIMMWYTFPDLQVISLEQYLEERMKEMKK